MHLGDMLDYYDVSGCFILKVTLCCSIPNRLPMTNLCVM